MRLFYLLPLLLIRMDAFTQPALTASSVSSFPAPLSGQLDSFFLHQPADKPGVALLVTKKGEILYRNAAGLADLSNGVKIDPSTNFRMASVTKQFTAMGILLLEQERKLSLEDPVRRYLPELPARTGDKILIRHLLTHSSGIPDYEPLIPASQTKQVLDEDVLHLLAKQDTSLFAPGSRFRYSNSGFCLLALVIERVSHQSFGAFIQEKIFEPLHMDQSTVYEEGRPIANRAMGYAKDGAGRIAFSDQSVTSATKGDGGVYTSLNDYAKWVRALQENKLLKLSRALKRLRYSIHEGTPYYYAAGWFIINTSPDLLFHSGGTCGFSTFVIQVPEDEISITYFSNQASNTDPFREIVRILREGGIADLSPVFALHDLTR